MIMVRLLLIAALLGSVGCAISLATLGGIPNLYPGGVRGKAYPIILVIESHETIRVEAIKRGMIEEDSSTVIMGFSAYNTTLTVCTIWVPVLRMGTMWIWVHEILHCNIGAFHED